jgi:hypothetical protein
MKKQMMENESEILTPIVHAAKRKSYQTQHTWPELSDSWSDLVIQSDGVIDVLFLTASETGVENEFSYISSSFTKSGQEPW